MSFLIQPHVRLQEWVAEEHGYFREAGLDYEFEPQGLAGSTVSTSSVRTADEAPIEVASGAFEDMQKGRTCLRLALERKVPAVNVFGPQYYALEQHGFRKLVDTTFMMGFLVSEDADVADVERYFTGLRHAQRDIDFEPGRYKHYWLREMPADIQRIVDVRRFGPGERIVPEPYTREMFEQTHRWMRTWDLFDPDAAMRPGYGEAVLT